MILLTIFEIIYLIQRNAFVLGYVKDLSDHEPSFLSYLLASFGYDRISIFYLAGPLLISVLYFSYKRNVILKYILFILVLSNIFISLISAQKERIAITLIVIFFYFYYWTKNNLNLNKKEVLMTIFISIFIILFPFFHAYRTLVNLGYEIESIINFKNIITIFEFVDEESLNYFLYRFDHLNTNLAVVKQTPTFIDYKIGTTYLKGLEAFLLLIPKSKKSSDFGLFNNSFAREYNLVEPFDYYSGITLPQFTEVYMNFGFFMIPIVMFFIGLFYGFIYKLMLSSNINSRFISFILYYYFVISFSALAFSTTMILTIKTFIGVFIFLTILNIDRIIKKVIR